MTKMYKCSHQMAGCRCRLMAQRHCEVFLMDFETDDISANFRECVNFIASIYSEETFLGKFNAVVSEFLYEPDLQLDDYMFIGITYLVIFSDSRKSIVTLTIADLTQDFVDASDYADVCKILMEKTKWPPFFYTYATTDLGETNHTKFNARIKWMIMKQYMRQLTGHEPEFTLSLTS